MNIEKEQFIENLYQREIDSVIENMEWDDTLVYYWPTFEQWLRDHGIEDKDIARIEDDYNLNWEWETIKTEHSGGFYTVSRDQFILCTDDEWEDELEWYSDEQREWIEEEFTVSGEYFYIYNPTAFYITIDDIRAWLAENA